MLGSIPFLVLDLRANVVYSVIVIGILVIYDCVGYLKGM